MRGPWRLTTSSAAKARAFWMALRPSSLCSRKPEEGSNTTGSILRFADGGNLVPKGRELGSALAAESVRTSERQDLRGIVGCHIRPEKELVQALQYEGVPFLTQVTLARLQRVPKSLQALRRRPWIRQVDDINRIGADRDRDRQGAAAADNSHVRNLLARALEASRQTACADIVVGGKQCLWISIFDQRICRCFVDQRNVEHGHVFATDTGPLAAGADVSQHAEVGRAGRPARGSAVRRAVKEKKIRVIGEARLDIARGRKKGAGKQTNLRLGSSISFATGAIHSIVAGPGPARSRLRSRVVRHARRPARCHEHRGEQQALDLGRSFEYGHVNLQERLQILSDDESSVK